MRHIRSRGRHHLVLLSVALTAGLVLLAVSSGASSAPLCTAANVSVLDGSNFEIDANANLKVDGTGTCIDWLTGGAGTGLRSGVVANGDAPSGAGDDAFGQGTSEDDANPTIVTGSIPPNKSDLKAFGVFQEVSSGTKFLQLFWSRVQNPSGTTNMDFELNQKVCDTTANPTNCANNGNKVASPETPVRTTGDRLITYDLSKGGTVPTISIRTWTGSAWGPAVVLSSNSPNPDAYGSVNTGTIPANESGGAFPAPGAGGPLGQQDPYTFGEAAIKFSALFPTGTSCGTFGGVYLKSRSSDSFNSEIKDFVKPERVKISNCTSLSTSASAAPTDGGPLGTAISDTATLSGATANATGNIRFRAYGPFADATVGTTTCTDANKVFDTTTGIGTADSSGNYVVTASFTPTAVGYYQWLATYTSGDPNNVNTSGACGDAGEVSLVRTYDTTTATTPVGSATSTTAVTSVTLGSTVYDRAVVTGNQAGGDPTGTVAFFVCKVDSPGLCTTGGTALGTPSLTSDGVDATFTSTAVSNGFTPPSSGRYCFRAVYSPTTGGPYRTSSDSAATECFVVPNDDTRTVTTPVATATGTTPFLTVPLGSSVYDRAVVSGTQAGGDPTGTVAFSVCKVDSPGLCTTGGTPLGNTQALTSDGNPSTFTSVAVSAAYTPSDPGRYCFRADYTPATGSSYNGSSDSAVTECFVVPKDNTTTVTSPVGSVSSTTRITSVTVDTTVFDRAVVSGTQAGGDPTGTVNFFVCKVASPGTCDGTTNVGTAVAGNPVSLVSDGVANTYTSVAVSGGFTPGEVGRYCFRAEYTPATGSPYNPSSDSAAVTECFDVTPIQSGITTAQSYYPNDTATITGGGTGTVDFKLYGPFTGAQTPVCTGTPVVSALNVAVAGGSAATNNTTQAVTASGTYVWLVSYSGDAKHTPATSSCGTEQFTLTVTNG